MHWVVLVNDGFQRQSLPCHLAVFSPADAGIMVLAFHRSARVLALEARSALLAKGVQVIRPERVLLSPRPKGGCACLPRFILRADVSVLDCRSNSHRFRLSPKQAL
jgi:hypothetical protein